MAKGKTMTPTPEGVISTSTGPVDPAVEKSVELSKRNYQKKSWTKRED
jgi:hypothetical protein